MLGNPGDTLTITDALTDGLDLVLTRANIADDILSVEIKELLNGRMNRTGITHLDKQTARVLFNALGVFLHT